MDFFKTRPGGVESLHESLRSWFVHERIRQFNFFLNFLIFHRKKCLSPRKIDTESSHESLRSWFFHSWIRQVNFFHENPGKFQIVEKKWNCRIHEWKNQLLRLSWGDSVSIFRGDQYFFNLDPLLGRVLKKSSSSSSSPPPSSSTWLSSVAWLPAVTVFKGVLLCSDFLCIVLCDGLLVWLAAGGHRVEFERCTAVLWLAAVGIRYKAGSEEVAKSASFLFTVGSW